jgi:phosphoserine phosphatase RsbU/P
MKFFQKKIVIKSIFILIILLLISGIVAGIFFTTDKQEITIKFYIGTLVVLSIIFFLLQQYLFVIPLTKITKEVKKLLVGKKYNRIFTKRVDEIGILAHFFNEITKAIQKLSTELKEGRRMSSELEIASKIQRGIIPQKAPFIPGLNIYAKTRPATEVGGDSFDFIQEGNNNFFYIGDVTGHGVPAALIMTIVNTLVHTFAKFYKTAFEIAVKTNELLYPRIAKTMFMTAILFKFDSQLQKLSYVGAGHEHIIIYKKNSGKCEKFMAGGLALGMIPDVSKIYKETDISLELGDTIIVFSDGIIEAKNVNGELFGIDRLVAACEKYCYQENIEDIFKSVSKEFSDYVEEQPQLDDITLIVMRKVPQQENIPAKETLTAWE